jgi:hypothetical protein
MQAHNGMKRKLSHYALGSSARACILNWVDMKSCVTVDNSRLHYAPDITQVIPSNSISFERKVSLTAYICYSFRGQFLAELPPDNHGFTEIRITNFYHKNYCDDVSYRRLGLSFKRELSSLSPLRNKVKHVRTKTETIRCYIS